jgi:hypothetical protein
MTVEYTPFEPIYKYDGYFAFAGSIAGLGAGIEVVHLQNLPADRAQTQIQKAQNHLKSISVVSADFPQNASSNLQISLSKDAAKYENHVSELAFDAPQPIDGMNVGASLLLSSVAGMIIFLNVSKGVRYINWRRNRNKERRQFIKETRDYIDSLPTGSDPTDLS